MLCLFSLLFLVFALTFSQPNHTGPFSIGERDILGFLRIEILNRNLDRNAVIQNCQSRLGNQCPATSILNRLYDEATRPSLLSERVRIARDLYDQYLANPSMLDNIICIDEKTIVNGRLEMIAAVYRGEIIAYDLLENRKARMWDINHFLHEILDPEMSRRGIDLNENNRPMLLWDNINVHTDEMIADSASLRFNVLEHPRQSPDMNPLDFYDFDLLMTKLRESWRTNGKQTSGLDLSVEQVKLDLEQAIAAMNMLKPFTGTQRLPEQWKKVIEQNGAPVLKKRTQWSYLSEALPDPQGQVPMDHDELR